MKSQGEASWPYSNEAWALFAARRYDEAIEKPQQYIEFGSGHGLSHVGLDLMYEAKGMYEQAINEYQKGVAIIGETISFQIYLGYALAMSGQRNKPQAILVKLKKTKEYVSPSVLAYLYIAPGDKEGAMATLERASPRTNPSCKTSKLTNTLTASARPALHRPRAPRRLHDINVVSTSYIHSRASVTGRCEKVTHPRRLGRGGRRVCWGCRRRLCTGQR